MIETQICLPLQHFPEESQGGRTHVLARAIHPHLVAGETLQNADRNKVLQASVFGSREKLDEIKDTAKGMIISRREQPVDMWVQDVLIDHMRYPVGE